MVLNFNSIKVQLEPYAEQIRNRFGLFQFHKGTIRTMAEFTEYISKAYFNSIKVQLERYSFLLRPCHSRISIP